MFRVKKYNGNKKQQLKLFELLTSSNTENNSGILIKIAEPGLIFILTTTKPICSLDFVGYIFPIHTRYQVSGMLDLYGNVNLFSTNPNKQLIQPKILYKILKHLLKISFIQLIIEPFPEFDSYYNVPIDSENTRFIDEPIFKDYLTENQLTEMRKLYEGMRDDIS